MPPVIDVALLTVATSSLSGCPEVPIPVSAVRSASPATSKPVPLRAPPASTLITAGAANRPATNRPSTTTFRPAVNCTSPGLTPLPSVVTSAVTMMSRTAPTI